LRLVPSANLFSASPPGERAIAADIDVLVRGLGLVSRRDVARVIRGYFSTDGIQVATLRIAAKTLRLTARRAA
jgi:hypothetical protein